MAAATGLACCATTSSVRSEQAFSRLCFNPEPGDLRLTWRVGQGTVLVRSPKRCYEMMAVWAMEELGTTGCGPRMTNERNEVTEGHGLLTNGAARHGASSMAELTRCWGDPGSVSSYLDRCQVDTPADVVRATWEHVSRLRPGKIGKVIDLGAGDGRFAHHGNYRSYIGYEIDAARCLEARLPKNARLINRCAFTDTITDADVCVGNPPFVRNQDMPDSWREHVHAVVKQRDGVHVSGLGNAWQYFFLQGLASLNTGGLAALVVPFEWVSRPAAKALRAYIREKGWRVYVYRLRGAGFARVMTTASITVVDKSGRDGKWEFHDETPDGLDRRMASPTGSSEAVLAYVRAADLPPEGARAKRGLSPGTQKLLTLTDEQRRDHGLSVKGDVAACVTSLRQLPEDVKELDRGTFRRHYVEGGRRCWLVRTDVEPSERLRDYLASVPASDRQTWTCQRRAEWWLFKMPEVPSMLFAQGFRGLFPKVVRNSVGAYAVGGVCGIYNASEEQMEALTGKLGGMDLRDLVVSYSSGFYKVEINQINALLAKLTVAADG